MRAAYRIFPVFILPALGILLPGCLESANPDRLSCTQNQYCPEGYACVGAQPGTPGKCQKSKDAGPVDAPAQTSDAVIGDAPEDDDDATVAGDLASSKDGRASLGDAAEALDHAASVDIPIGLDGAPDVQVPADVGYEARPDTPI